MKINKKIIPVYIFSNCDKGYSHIEEILRNFITEKSIASWVPSLFCPRGEFPATVLLNDDFLITPEQKSVTVVSFQVPASIWPFLQHPATLQMEGL